MSDSVLDLIDNVIDAHGDAMRWSPNAPDPTPSEPPRRYVTVTFALLDETYLDLRAAVAAATTAFTFMGQTFLKVVPPADVACQARLRRMRHLYRQRRR